MIRAISCVLEQEYIGRKPGEAARSRDPAQKSQSEQQSSCKQPRMSVLLYRASMVNAKTTKHRAGNICRRFAGVPPARSGDAGGTPVNRIEVPTLIFRTMLMMRKNLCIDAQRYSQSDALASEMQGVSTTSVLVWFKNDPSAAK